MVIVPKKVPRRNRRKKKARERNRALLRQRRRTILLRIQNRPEPERDVPMITASNIHYELGERVHGLSPGGIGAMLLLARTTGLVAAIDADLHVLKRHQPYHESDHVLNIPRRRPHPRPHHRGGLLSSVPAIRCPLLDGGHQ
jgi:hypothetical protein